MTVKEYSIKSIELYKYVSFFVLNDRDEMSRYVMGVSGDLDEECRAAMLHDNMDLSRMIFHAHQA